MRLAVAAVIGVNLGLAVSTLAFGWTDDQARRVATGNLMAKALPAGVVLLALPHVVAWFEWVPSGIDKQVAMAHTAFNLAVAMLWLPLLSPMDRVLHQVLPDRVTTTKFAPRYITPEPVEGFAMAAGQSQRELLRIAEIVRLMLDDMWRALAERDETLARDVQRRDDQVDLLDNAVKQYLARLAVYEDDQEDAAEIMRQLTYLTELEVIGDVIDKNLAELAIKRARVGVRFSEEGWHELSRFCGMVGQNLLIAETAFATRDRTLACQLLRHHAYLSQCERRYRELHFGRLCQGMACSRESSSIHLDLLSYLSQINGAVSRVVHCV